MAERIFVLKYVWSNIFLIELSGQKISALEFTYSLCSVHSLWNMSSLYLYDPWNRRTNKFNLRCGFKMAVWILLNFVSYCSMFDCYNQLPSLAEDFYDIMMVDAEFWIFLRFSLTYCRFFCGLTLFSVAWEKRFFCSQSLEVIDAMLYSTKLCCIWVAI